MSKHNRKGRSKTSGNFIKLDHYIKRSAAWQSLSLGARCAHLELLDIFNGSNNGRLAMSARDLAQRMRMSYRQCSSYLLELIDKKFIEVVQEGGFSRKLGERRATEYRLTSHRCDVTGELPSKAFMQHGKGVTSAEGGVPPRAAIPLADTGGVAGKTNGAGE